MGSAGHDPKNRPQYLTHEEREAFRVGYREGWCEANKNLPHEQFVEEFLALKAAGAVFC